VKSGVTVTASSRIHIGLLDLGRATGRTFGGLGFMLDNPSVQVTAEPHDQTEFVCPTTVERNTKAYIARRIEELVRAIPGRNVRIVINKALPEHVGLGSKTAMTMAALVAAGLATNRNLSQEQLQKFSRRGGASGVGIHGFFHGGFIIDAGRLGNHPFLPSSIQRLRLYRP
jgi:beta-ribofuranosylaminobenzene 5'-phosphate synthase